MTNERTSHDVARIAGRVLRRGYATTQEGLILAASCLTQTRNRSLPRKRRKTRKVV